MKTNGFKKSYIFIVLILLLAIGLAACSAGSGQADLAGPEWQLASLSGESVPAGVTITATFAEKEVGGSSGCNSYGGPYTLNGNQIEIGPLAATLMACDEPQMSWEGNYLKAMQSAESYQISGNQLEITTGEGVLKFNSD